ncbi:MULTISPECIES: hypothetical protein [unclassified Streptomyces]|uniref:hypothetical protein n=1 Tax=unclassified Streptomyces TaxID=2593676 RepID=UPI00278C35D1|nr:MULTISPECIES: hypothetical protein [unclassified Streptomyces]
MLDTPQLPDQLDADQGQAPQLPSEPAPPTPVPTEKQADRQRGCLFALSQPPLMIFLGVIGSLLLMAALHDLLLL